MKLWDKGQSTQRSVEEFTVGKDREFDLLLAKYDVMGSIAHATMLSEVGLLSVDEAKALVQELGRIAEEIVAGRFRIEDSVEDVHSQVEKILTERVGEAGKKIHTGRSRNDQVLVDLKLFFRAQLIALAEQVQQLFDVLMQLAKTHSNTLLPGYTHFQIAMPSSFGLWFSAYAESLVDDLEMLTAAYNTVNKNPLGSAAGYGSTFALDRERTTELLGFAQLNVSSIYAQMTRGKSERVCATAIAAFASTIGRMAYDLCLYSSQNFNFLKLAAEYTTGSSLMPHKANPDVFELVRAHCSRLQALPNDIALLTNNLPSGYHRDFQILKELIFPAFDEIKACLSMCIESLPRISINPDILSNEKYALVYSVDAVHALVQQGTSFRDAYRAVAEQIQKDEFKYDPELISGTEAHQGSIGNPRLDLIEAQMKQFSDQKLGQAAQQAEQKLLQMAR